MKKIDKDLFEFAESTMKEELIGFLDTYEKKQFNEIHYYDVGDSDNVIMMLPSSNGHGIVFFKYILALSDHYRIIAPDYTIGVDLKAQYEGFVQLADHLSIDKFNLFGYSFGSVLAQLMVKEYPERISNLIIFDGETKTKHIHPKLVRKFVKSYRRLNRTLLYLSNKWMVRSLNKRIAFDVKVGMENNRHFWESFYKQILKDTSKDNMRLIYKNVYEFWSSYELNSEDFDAYTGGILILNVVGAMQRVEVQELEHLFSNGNIKTYDASFRMSLVTCRKQVLKDIHSFIISDNE